MSNETALGAALKQAVQTMSKKKQTEMITEYIYSKYDVFNRFKPLAIGIDQDIVAALPQFDPSLIARFLSNHCRRPRYIKALARGGKRFGLNGKFKGDVTAEEQEIAKAHPCMQAQNKEAAATKVNTPDVPANESTASDISAEQDAQ